MNKNKKIVSLLILVTALALGVTVFQNFFADKPVARSMDEEQISAAADGSDSADASDATQQNGAETSLVEIVGDALETPNPLGEIVMGDPDAPVTIVEYASLTCPHCGAFHNEILPILDEEFVKTGKVKFYFRPFPFDGVATAGAMLVQCSAPNRRVGFLKVLFERQSQWLMSSDPVEDLKRISKQAGLSETDFQVCLKDERILNGIRAMQKAADEQLGVNSTPTFFINGEMLRGHQPVDVFRKAINDQLPNDMKSSN